MRGTGPHRPQSLAPFGQLLAHWVKWEMAPCRPSAPVSAFFRHKGAPTAFAVPFSAEYLRELHACWRDTGALPHLSADGWAQQLCVTPRELAWIACQLLRPPLPHLLCLRMKRCNLLSGVLNLKVQGPSAVLEPGELSGSAALEAPE